MNDIDKLNKLNEKLNSQLSDIASKNNNKNLTSIYQAENVIIISILNKQNNLKYLSNKTNNEENKTPSSNEQRNNLTIHMNNCNQDTGFNDKKIMLYIPF